MRLATRLEIGFLITAYIVGIVGVGIADRWILEAMGPHPAIAQTTFYTLVTIEGLGGLIGFFFLLSRVEFLWRGYQVSLRNGRAYYEERGTSGERRRLAFEWFPLTGGYRPRGIVRLSRRDSWDVDAPAWAQGRRDEIAGRIVKDLSSYENWPALLMPDAAIDSESDANVTRALIRGVLDRCPEWAPYVRPRPEAGHTDRVLLSVPPPEHPLHRLEVVHCGEAFEIAYDCGEPGLRAVARIGLAANDSAAALFCVCEFLREFREGEMVVLVRRLDLPTRRRRRDGARYGAEFRSVSRSAQYSRRSVYVWDTEQSQNAR
jgi:hypothetical protein